MVKLSNRDQYLQLYFSSTSFRKFMQSFSNFPENFSLNNSPVFISKFTESLISYLITESSLALNKSTKGLYEMSYDSLEAAIYKSSELQSNFLHYVLAYNSTINYNVLDCKELKKFIETINVNIKIDASAINFIQYLINSIICDFMRISSIIMDEFKKVRINSVVIRTVVSIMFKGSYQQRIKKTMEELINKLDSYREMENEKQAQRMKDKLEEEKKKLSELTDKLDNCKELLKKEKKAEEKKKLEEEEKKLSEEVNKIKEVVNKLEQELKDKAEKKEKVDEAVEEKTDDVLDKSKEVSLE